MRKLFFCALFVFSVFSQMTKGAERISFKPGEKLSFELKWGIISAGTANLDILPIEEVKGQRLFHFQLTAQSNKFIDVFYRVRDQVDAYTDIGITESRLFKKDQHEGRYEKSYEVQFDWMKNQAIRTDKDGKVNQVELMAGAFDPWSVFYYFRKLDLDVGREYSVPVSDGKKCVYGKVRVVKREKISVPAGDFEAFLVEPEIKYIGGVFNKSDEDKLLIWITADERKIPIRIKSKVVVGSFYADLIKYELSSQ